MVSAPTSLLLPDDLDPDAPEGRVAGAPGGFGTPLRGRADPPMSSWAGRWMTERDVGMSAGDERDWFTFEMRLQAHYDAIRRFCEARQRRRKLSSRFDFAQIMFIGDMGASKSVSAGHEAYKWFQRGHPFFHNGGFNFGRVVEGADIYELVDAVPRHSVIAIDEAHTGLESGMAMSTGVRAFAILCAGLRKKNCKLLLMTAMARMVVRMVREMTSEVRRPLKVRAAAQDHGWSVEYPGHSDPKNFVLAWELWRDFPFRGVDITEGRRARKDGLGPADDVRVAAGEAVRNAFMLTDSFRPVDTAHAQIYAGKAAMEESRAGRTETGFTDRHMAVVEYLWSRAATPDCPRYIKPEVIALALEMRPQAVGRILSGLFGDIDGARKTNGYDMNTLRVVIPVMFEMD